jgi:thioesterase domain-containing protein
VLGLNSIGLNDDYFDLGGHSLLAVRLFSEINLEFNTQLPLGTLFRAPTVRAMSEFIRSAGVQRVQSAIVPIQRDGPRPPIFCIGPLNGEVLLFRRLAMDLGPEQPVYGLEPFGLGDRVSALLRVESIAAYYVEQMKAAGKDRPYCLLGYSFGGLVAIEMAQQLREHGEQVPAVVLIDTVYPAVCKAREGFDHRLRRYRYNLREVLFGPDGFGHLHRRLKKRYVEVVYRGASAIGAPVPNLTKSLVDRQLLASDRYRARPYAGRVFLFKAESRPQFFDGGPELGWTGILSHLVIHEIPGDHGTINTGTNLKILAQKLKSCLEPRELFSHHNFDIEEHADHPCPRRD